jgi:hypothetical protein
MNLARSTSLALPLLVLVSLPIDAIAQPFRHDRWDRLLKAHVTAEGWVDYEALAGKSARELKAYLRELAAADPAKLGGPKDEMAFWINAYNAICVQTLIDHGLPATVPHAKVIGANIFTEKKYEVAGEVRSLDGIEHGILRARFKEPRVHAAVVCGAESCPRLRPEAFTGERLEKQLDEEAVSWIQKEKDRKGRRKNHLDREAGILHASKIFDWYGEDFGGDRGVIDFIAMYSAEADRDFIRKNKVRLKHLPYDWSINGQERPRK